MDDDGKKAGTLWELDEFARIANETMASSGPSTGSDERQKQELSPRNLRRLVSEGVIDPPERSGRSAYYSEKHLEQVLAVRNMMSQGFSTSAIRSVKESSLGFSGSAAPSPVLTGGAEGSSAAVSYLNSLLGTSTDSKGSGWSLPKTDSAESLGARGALGLMGGQALSPSVDAQSYNALKCTPKGLFSGIQDREGRPADLVEGVRPELKASVEPVQSPDLDLCFEVKAFEGVSIKVSSKAFDHHPRVSLTDADKEQIWRALETAWSAAAKMK